MFVRGAYIQDFNVFFLVSTRTSCVGFVVVQMVKGLAPALGDGARAFQLIAYFVISTGYAMGLEWFWHGQTLGKRILGLRVMDSEGRWLRPAQVILRNLIRPLDMLPLLYGVGGTVSLLSRYSQRLGDLAANTIVVRPVRAQLPDVEQLRTGKYNSLREYPHLAARLKRRVTPEVAAIAAEAVLRRDSLEPTARVRLFGELAAHFRSWWSIRRRLSRISRMSVMSAMFWKWFSSAE